MGSRRLALLAAAALVLMACAPPADKPVTIGVGPNPQLPEPDKPLITTVHIAPAVGWPSGVTPATAPGTRVVAFASGLDHPRWVYVLPNGDVLVAESNAPKRPDRTGFVLLDHG